MKTLVRQGIGRVVSFLVIAVALLACGAGPYGFSRYYEPSMAEKPFHESSREYTLGVVNARPQDFINQLIGWFGVVEKIDRQKDGRYLVRLAFHKHKERQLCEGESERTCRVTINQRSSGGFSALLEIRPEDLIPSLDKVQPRTLMRVFGKVRCRKVNSEYELDRYACDYDEKGGVLLEGEFYRQWPRRFYRTTYTAQKMVR